MKDNVGTLVPVRALRSARPDLAEESGGTFATGETFIEWLAATGQGLWQMLPLAETHLEQGSSSVRVPSPYRGYGIGLDPTYVPATEASAVPTDEEIARFRSEHSAWLGDYALFCALRDEAGTDDWTAWEPTLRDRDPGVLAAWAKDHADAVLAHEVGQWRAHRAFARMREKARQADVRLMGDLPFYLPQQSPLAWTHRGAFEFGGGVCQRVSGVPESADSFFGRQVWGHPLYRWDDFEAVMGLWRLRISHVASLYDMLRIDHAKGFYRYGAISTCDEREDAYVDGPGSDALGPVLLAARSCGVEPFVEDSGMHVHEDMIRLLDRLEVPGVRIIRFAYNERRGVYRDEHADVQSYPRGCVAYSSTHDTLPLAGYASVLGPLRRLRVALKIASKVCLSGKSFAKSLRDALLRSAAEYKIVQIQDWLFVPGRINTPGTELPVDDPNWRWRMPKPVEELPLDLSLPANR